MTRLCRAAQPAAGGDGAPSLDIGAGYRTIGAGDRHPLEDRFVGPSPDTLGIDAPPERVFAVYTDPARIPEWEEVRVLDATGPLDRAGTRFVTAPGTGMRFRTEVVRSDPPHLHEQAGRTSSGFSYHWTATFEPDGGSTRLTLESEYGLALGVVGRLLDRLFVGRMSEGTTRGHLDRLKAIAERG